MSALQGQAAIVTGASRGIGAATARALAKDGVSVILAARSSADIERLAAEIRDAGGKAEAATCDVTSYDDVARTIALCRDKFGRLDILVNNAGTIDPIARLAESDVEAWCRAVDINYRGVYFGLRAALPVMQAQGSGVIVNMSSGAAAGALEGWSHYCSTKAAVLSLTRCVHKEYHDDGVRIVGLSPGAVATDMQLAIKASGINPVSQLDPAGHISPTWVGRAVVWLCTEAAAEFAGTDVSLRDADLRRRIGLET